MIESYMVNGKWRLKITGEEWEFNEFQEFQDVLYGIVERKEKYGRLVK